MDPREVKCVNPISLAEKDQDCGLTLNELVHGLEEECVRNGLPLRDDLLLKDPPIEPRSPGTPSWRICGNFAELNKYLKVVLMPQGDIRDKQRRLSGHRYVSVFDFASGFFALYVDENVQPYLCVFVPGRGYFAYKQMPFRLSDAPTAFRDMVAQRMWDLIITELMELFVDDGGMAADEFKEMLGKL
jgi:hypothetical protein